MARETRGLCGGCGGAEFPGVLEETVACGTCTGPTALVLWGAVGSAESELTARVILGLCEGGADTVGC